MLTIDDHKTQLKEAGLRFRVLSDWKGTVAPTTYQCCKCKYTWDGAPNYVRRLAGCPRCTKRMTNKTTDDYATEIAKLNPGVRVLGQYAGCNIKIEHQCSTCAHSWLAMPINIRRGTGCPKCAAKRKSEKAIGRIKSSQSRRVRVKVNGKSFDVQGYEPHAIRWLVEEAGVSVKDIRTTKLPVFDYKIQGEQRRYYPDMLVKGKYVVEVKSMFVAGITSTKYALGKTPKQLWDTLRAKARAVERQGFVFRLLVIDKKGNRVSMPKEWRRYSHSQILTNFDLQNV